MGNVVLAIDFHHDEPANDSEIQKQREKQQNGRQSFAHGGLLLEQIRCDGAFTEGRNIAVIGVLVLLRVYLGGIFGKGIDVWIGGFADGNAKNQAESHRRERGYGLETTGTFKMYAPAFVGGNLIHNAVVEPAGKFRLGLSVQDLPQADAVLSIGTTSRAILQMQIQRAVFPQLVIKLKFDQAFSFAASHGFLSLASKMASRFLCFIIYTLPSRLSFNNFFRSCFFARTSSDSTAFTLMPSCSAISL
jgi:hypothetical protein